MKPRALAPLGLALFACSGGQPEGPAAPAYVLSPVVAEARAALPEALLPAPTFFAAEPVSALDTLPASEPELVERLEGLLVFLESATGALRDTVFDELDSLERDARPFLLRSMLDIAREEAARLAALELASHLGGELVVQVFVEVLRSSEEAWLRSHCAYRLGELGSDELVPELLHRLQYERDDDAAIWLARSLARRKNFAGLPGLFVVWERGDDARRASAEARLIEIAQELGLSDAGAVRAAWETGDPERVLPTPDRGPGWERAVWDWIARMNDFQLRPVDDARVVLLGLSSEALPLLTRALRDEDEYVRVHTAQVLERMGVRARPAVPELVAALRDPGACDEAAAALGEIGGDGAGEALLAALEPAGSLDLRIAAARALGQLQYGQAEAALAALLDDAEVAVDLRQAAAESLVYLEVAAPPLEALLEWIPSGLVEPSTSEAALRWWLGQRAAQPDPEAQAALEAWDAAGVYPTGQVPSLEQSRAVRAERVELVRALLAR